MIISFYRFIRWSLSVGSIFEKKFSSLTVLLKQSRDLLSVWNYRWFFFTLFFPWVLIFKDSFVIDFRSILCLWNTLVCTVPYVKNFFIKPLSLICLSVDVFRCYFFVFETYFPFYINSQWCNIISWETYSCFLVFRKFFVL